MNQDSLEFLNPIFENVNLDEISILIVNQTEKGKEIHSENTKVRVLNSYEYGVSKSRNLALENSIGDICIITDDDVVFESNAFDIIQHSFKKNDAALIRFCYSDLKGEKFKKYRYTNQFAKKVNQFGSISSIEIVVDRKKIVDANLKFNENFGLGSTFKMGEEFLFTRDVFQNKKTIYLSEKFIVKHSRFSSGSNLKSKEYIESKAAVKYIQYGNYFYLWSLKFLFFLIRKKYISLTESQKVFTHLINGIKKHKKIING